MISSLSEIYGAHHVSLHHITPLDFTSVRQVPDSHAWPEEHGLDHHSSLDTSSGIPTVIDLADTKTAVELVGSACQTWGAFQITNHGISTSLLDEVESECWRLFSLPTQRKLKVLRSPNGVTGYGLPRISPFFSKIMWHEGFTIIGSPKEHAYQLWPNNYTHFCDVLEEYQKEMKKLSERLMRLMFESLGANPTDCNEFIKGANTALQLNSYPACPDPNRAMGLVPHTDTSLFTILYQSSTSGLQIFREEVGWVTLPPQDGALTVNVGDFLHILSNGRFPSALHRAVVNKTHHRLSNAYFYGPPISAQISPLSQLVDETHPPQYRSVSCSDYFGLKAKYLDKALSFIHL